MNQKELYDAYYEKFGEYPLFPLPLSNDLLERSIKSVTKIVEIGPPDNTLDGGFLALDGDPIPNGYHVRIV